MTSPETHWHEALAQGRLLLQRATGSGAIFFPPLVTMRSFLRSVMRRNPSESISPMSPVWNHPPSSAAEVSSGRFQ